MDNHDLTDLQRLVVSRRRFIGTGALAGAALCHYCLRRSCR